MSFDTPSYIDQQKKLLAWARTCSDWGRRLLPPVLASKPHGSQPMPECKCFGEGC